MGVWLALVLVLPTLLWASQLEIARSYVERGDQENAFKHYAKIGFKHQDWNRKIEDAIRFQLLSANPLEAWRITQLATRLNRKVSELRYYESLAALGSGSCPLNRRVEDESRRFLMLAYAYRFPQRFRAPSYEGAVFAAADSGKLKNHLGDDGVHFSSDIPKARLLRQMGCRFMHGAMEHQTELPKYELKALAKWRKSRDEKNQLRGSEKVLARMLILALRIEDEQQTSELLETFFRYTEDQWLALAEPYRRFIWHELVEAKKFAKAPVGKHDPRFDLVLRIIYSAPNPHVWLGYLNYDELAIGERTKLFRHLAEKKSPSNPHLPYILARLAADRYTKGDFNESLHLIRRLLVLGEAEGNEAVIRFSEDIAVKIFTEYQYDHKLLGAVQASLPRASWKRVFLNLLSRHALHGNTRGFKNLRKIIDKTKLGTRLGLSERSWSVLKSLAKRRIAKFSRTLRELKQRRVLSSRDLKGVNLIALQVFDADPSLVMQLSPYFSEIQAMLRDHMNRNRRFAERYGELYEIFGSDTKDDWEKGRTSVTRGGFSMGVADLSVIPKLVSPVKWLQPATLARENLVVVPDKVGNRKWVIR